MPANSQTGVIYDASSINVAAIVFPTSSTTADGQTIRFIFQHTVAVNLAWISDSYAILGAPATITMPTDGTYYTITFKRVTISGTTYWVMVGK